MLEAVVNYMAGLAKSVNSQERLTAAMNNQLAKIIVSSRGSEKPL